VSSDGPRLISDSRRSAAHQGRNLWSLRLEGIQIGDIVEVDRLGRRFHALVTGNANACLSVQPLDRRISYRTCRAHDVVAHWAKRGRPRQTNEPLEPSPLQLELDTTVRE
jgi:hypothetical protein